MIEGVASGVEAVAEAVVEVVPSLSLLVEVGLGLLL